MDKLIKYLVGLAITIAIMYAIGIIISLIIIGVMVLIKKLIPQKEYTKWVLYKTDDPLLVLPPEGGLFFQRQKSYKRYNNFKNEWEYKTVTDPIKRPLSEASTIAEVYQFYHFNHPRKFH